MLQLQELKQHYLNKGKKIIKRQEWYIKHGEDSDPAQRQMFDALSKMMIQSDDPVNFIFTGNTIEEKSDSIMLAMSNGEITPAQGEKIMGILRSSYEIGQMSELLEKLQTAGLIPQQ